MHRPGHQPSVDLFCYQCTFLRDIPNLKLSPLHVPQATRKSLR